MKQLLVALLCAAALAGCSSEYLISTNDGQMDDATVRQLYQLEIEEQEAQQLVAT